MRRFRLSTLLLLVVIAALIIALVVRERRAARREAELQAEMANLQARLAQSWPVFLKQRQNADINLMIKSMEYRMRTKLAERGEVEDPWPSKRRAANTRPSK
jgi:hypothetical protein